MEDNPVNVLVLVGLLERLGCPADHVENGRLGVEAVLATKYDLVFMDIQVCTGPETGGGCDNVLVFFFPCAFGMGALSMSANGGERMCD